MYNFRGSLEELSLGGIELPELLGRLCGIFSVVGIKLPLAYDVSSFLLNPRLAPPGIHVQTIVSHRRNNKRYSITCM